MEVLSTVGLQLIPVSGPLLVIPDEPELVLQPGGLDPGHYLIRYFEGPTVECRGRTGAVDDGLSPIIHDVEHDVWNIPHRGDGVDRIVVEFYAGGEVVIRLSDIAPLLPFQRPGLQVEDPSDDCHTEGIVRVVNELSGRKQLR